MQPGDIVTEKKRLAPPAQRKVYRVLGPSRAPGKIRVETWSHASQTWSMPHAENADEFCPAPPDWRQTRAARRALAAPEPARRRL